MINVHVNNYGKSALILHTHGTDMTICSLYTLSAPLLPKQGSASDSFNQQQ